MSLCFLVPTRTPTDSFANIFLKEQSLIKCLCKRSNECKDNSTIAHERLATFAEIPNINMSKSFILGSIASLIIVTGGVYWFYTAQNAPQQKINTGECINKCLDTRDSCLSRNDIQFMDCTTACNKKITNAWGFDYDSCVREADFQMQECKFLSADECAKISKEKLQYCKDKKTEIDSCLNPCADAKQKEYSRCMEAFDQCANKCPSECETNEDCDTRAGNSCAISTCAEVDMGRASGLKRKLCSYSYQSHGTCCPGSSGPNTCQMAGLSETTCTGGPCGDRDNDGVPDGEDNCPDSPGTYKEGCEQKTDEIEKEPIKIDVSKSPTIDSMYKKICDEQHHQFSIEIVPSDLAGRTVTGIEVDLAARGFSIPPVNTGDINLNDTGFGKADWKCTTTSSVFRCFGEKKLIEGKRSTIMLNFSSASAIANPPDYLSIKLLGSDGTSVVGIGTEFKPNE